MDFVRLTQYSSFVETISPDHFDVSIVVAGKKRCAIGWTAEFDERVAVWEGATVEWLPTGERGYATVAARLFDMTEKHARQLFHIDLRDKELLPWVKVRCGTNMTPKDMGQRIRDFVEYHEANPPPPEPVIEVVEEVEEAEEVEDTQPEEESPTDTRTPLQILGL